MTELPQRFAVCLALVVLSVESARAAEDGCFGDWSLAAPIVKAEGLASVETVTELARAHVKGDIVRVTLCRTGGIYSYRLVFRTPEGQHKSLTVDAKTPFAR